MNDDIRRESPASDSGAYVVNALNPTERAAFEGELEHSEELRNEVTELNDTAVLLGMAVAPVAPSAELKNSIMSRLDSVAQLPRDVTPARSVASGAVNRRAQSRWFSRSAVLMTAAAVVVAVVVGGGIAVSLSIANNGTQQVQQADALAAITLAADHQTAVAPIATGGKATLLWSPSEHKAALKVNGLKELPRDKTYELWYIDTAGVPKAAGTFNVADNTSWRMLEGKMRKGDTVGITVEPAGGSTTPTTTPIVAIASA